MFGFNLSFGIFIGDDAFRSLNNDTVEESHADITVPTIPTTHRERIQREREQEILADQESLYILETATAANSERAEKLDRESLAVLLNSTKSLEIRQKSFAMPTKASYHPAASQSSILYGTPLFSSPSFCTPRSSDSNSATLKSTNEGDDFLASGATASKAAVAVAKKISWERLSTKLAAAGWSQSSIEAVVDTQKACPRGKADSVYGWFDRLQQKDDEDEWNRFELELRESIVTPVSSPNSGRGGSSVRKDRIEEKQRNMNNKHHRDRDILPNLSTGKGNNQESNRQMDEDASDGGEEWMSVDHLGHEGRMFGGPTNLNAKNNRHSLY